MNKNPKKTDLHFKTRISHYPDKTSINLVEHKADQEKKSTWIAFGIFLVCFAVFVEVAILSPMRKIDEARSRYYAQKRIVDALKETNSDFGKIKKDFDKVSDWYMDASEKKESDKYEALLMLQEDVLPYTTVEALTMTGEEIAVSTGVMKMQDVSDMLIRLQSDQRNACVSLETTVATDQEETTKDLVRANIRIVYRNNAERENANA